MQKKIFITYTILLFIGIVLTGLLTLSLVSTSYMNDVEKRLITNATLINKFIVEEIKDRGFDKLDYSKYAQEYGETGKTRVSFINSKGVVMGDTEIKKSDLYKIENHLERPEVQEALNGHIGVTQRKSYTTNNDYIYVAIPIMIDGRIEGVTRLAFLITEVNQLTNKLIQNNLIAVFCGLLVVTSLGYRYISTVTKPIQEITSTAQKIANGGFLNRVSIHSKDEIGALADTFNLMAEKLNITISEMRDQNTRLQSILTSMNEALIAVDRTNKIMLINPVAMKLFNISDENVYGKDILEIIRNQELLFQFKKILHNKSIEVNEITIHEPETKILRVHTNFIRLDMDPNRVIGIMSLIQDITEVRKLENIRSDFVANVSHELKTPLTSISGFIETLKAGAINNENVRNKFLDIIEIETDRITRLIDDLLSLSAIEYNKGSSKLEPIDIKETINQVSIMVENLVLQKAITYEVEIESAIPMINGNRDWFKQMLLNLIENAIKYTSDHGKVKVLVYRRYESIFIVVKDTGIGIPKEDIPRLFERFYRVDKARSRKVGGTGLGLAIVKHIVLSFKGDIRVNSELGKGSEFIVRFPIQ